MIYETLIILAAVFGLLQLFRIASTFARLLVVAQVIAIGLTFIPNDSVVSVGFALFTVAALGAVIYAIATQNLEGKERVCILLIAVPVFVANVFSVSNWPYVGVIGFSMAIPMLAFLVLALPNLKQYKNELGFTVIMVTDAAIRLALSVELLSA